MSYTITIMKGTAQVGQIPGWDPSANQQPGTNPPVYDVNTAPYSIPADPAYTVTCEPNDYHETSFVDEGGFLKRIEMQDGGGGGK